MLKLVSSRGRWGLYYDHAHSDVTPDMGPVAPPITQQDIQAAQIVANIPDEAERAKLMSILQVMKTPSRPGDPASMMAPLLMSQMSNTSRPPQDSAKIVLDTLTAAKQLGAPPQAVDIPSLINAVAGLMRREPTEKDETVKDVMNKVVQLAFPSEPPKSWVEELMDNPDKLASLQRIAGGNQSIEFMNLQREDVERPEEVGHRDEADGSGTAA